MKGVVEDFINSSRGTNYQQLLHRIAGVDLFYVQGTWRTIIKINYYDPQERDVYLIYPTHSSLRLRFGAIDPAAEKLYPISVLQYPQWLSLTMMCLSSFLPFVLYEGSCFLYAICNNIHYFHIRWYSSCRSEVVTRRLPLVNNELLTLVYPSRASVISCCSIFWSVYCFAYLYCIFVPFFLAIV